MDKKKKKWDTGKPCEPGSFCHDQLQAGRMEVEQRLTELALEHRYIACVEAAAQIAFLRDQEVAALTYLCQWHSNDVEERLSVEKVRVHGIMAYQAWCAFWTFVHGLDEGSGERWLTRGGKRFATSMEGLSWLCRSWTIRTDEPNMPAELVAGIKHVNDAALAALKKTRAELEVTLGIHFTTPNTTEENGN